MALLQHDRNLLDLSLATEATALKCWACDASMHRVDGPNQYDWASPRRR